MAGLLSQYGYTLLSDENRHLADLWLVNTCTVPLLLLLAARLAYGDQDTY